MSSHFVKSCEVQDERVIANVIKSDGTEFVKMMCLNCGKIWIDVHQNEELF